MMTVATAARQQTSESSFWERICYREYTTRQRFRLADLRVRIRLGGEGFFGAGLGARQGFANHGEIGRDAEVAGAPVAQLGHHGDEFVAGLGEVVGDLRRNGWLD